MNEITITIDGRAIKTCEYILNAARANGIFIPAICYLTRCSPTLAHAVSVWSKRTENRFMRVMQKQRGDGILRQPPQIFLRNAVRLWKYTM